MNGFVVRASHFLSHPFGEHWFSPAATSRSAVANSVIPTAADADLSWMSLSTTRSEATNPRDDLAWLSLESDERDDSRGEIAWLGLEEE